MGSVGVLRAGDCDAHITALFADISARPASARTERQPRFAAKLGRHALGTPAHASLVALPLPAMASTNARVRVCVCVIAPCCSTLLCLICVTDYS